MPKVRILRSSSDNNERGGWIAIALLAVLVTLLGGASRPDEVQLALLRPICALFLIPVIYFYTPACFRDFRAPLFFLGSLAAIMALQILPLPPSIWHSLPGRENIAELSRLTGIAENWRPVSFVPARTLNALLSLLVPVLALLVIAVMRVKRATLLVVVASIGFFDAALGLTQIISSGNPALYPYRITNMGTAVGIFANQNHSAVFGAVTLMVVAYMLCNTDGNRRPKWQRAALLMAYVIILLSALTGGSRAGLLATLIAILSTGVMFWLSIGGNRKGYSGIPSAFGIQIGPGMLFSLVALVITGIVGVFVLFDRVPALQSLTTSGSFDDLRWQILPTLQAMIGTFWLLGSGFGSFEEVYHLFEPAELLGPAYVNQAHNDWAQFLIEGGLAAILVLLAGFGWVVRCLLKLGLATRKNLQSQLFWLSTMAIIIFASLVDYPLRTPVFQFVLILLLARLALESSEQRNAPANPE